MASQASLSGWSRLTLCERDGLNVSWWSVWLLFPAAFHASLEGQNKYNHTGIYGLEPQGHCPLSSINPPGMNCLHFCVYHFHRLVLLAHSAVLPGGVQSTLKLFCALCLCRWERPRLVHVLSSTAPKSWLAAAPVSLRSPHCPESFCLVMSTAFLCANPQNLMPTDTAPGGVPMIQSISVLCVFATSSGYGLACSPGSAALGS